MKNQVIESLLDMAMPVNHGSGERFSDSAREFTVVIVYAAILVVGFLAAMEAIGLKIVWNVCEKNKNPVF